MNAAVRKLVRGSIIALITSASLWLALVSYAYAEIINQFEAELLMQSDGQVLVTETITYDFGSANRHGIYRNINEVHPQEPTSLLKERYVGYELLSVKRNGQDEPFTLESYDGLSVRIGDANKTITGQQVYEISYLMKGAVSTYDTGHELYWNITGDEWRVIMEEVLVTFKGVDGVVLQPEQACYVGTYGSNARCDSELVDGTAVFYENSLAPGAQVTIAQRISLPQEPQIIEKVNLLPLIAGVCVLWLVGFGTWLWRWKYQFKSNRPIIAQYEPYKDFKPMFTGVLFDNRLDQKDITAGIVYLAEQGFISIKQTKDKAFFLFETTDYELTLNRPLEEVETDFQRELFRLFDLFTVGQVVKLSSIKKKQSKLKANQKIILELGKATTKDLVEAGYLQQRMKRALVAVATGLSFFGLFFMLPILVDSFAAGGLLLAGTTFVSILLVLIHGTERRTALGFEAENHLEGFELFLSVTDKERFDFHNAPEKSPQQFMEYLPYAIAFGVEEKWAKVFEDIQIADPSWYQGASNNAFNASVLTSDLGSFSAALASASAPQGSSGSGGGGFSGGGGGGGGGGSW